MFKYISKVGEGSLREFSLMHSVLKLFLVFLTLTDETVKQNAALSSCVIFI